MGMTKTSAHRRPFTPLPTLGRDAAKVSNDEDFLMRARVQCFGLAGLWPALENLSGRKPRGLGSVYGESVLPFGFKAAADALVWGLKTVVFTFHQSVCLGFRPDRSRIAPFARLTGSLRTREPGRFG